MSSGRALVARLDNNGDMLLAGPAIRAVAADSERVTLLCSRRGVDAGRLLPGVDDILVTEAPWIDPEPDPVDRGTINRLVSQIAGQAPDEAVIFTSFHQSPLPLALLLRLAGVPRIAAISADYPGSLLDIRHQVPDDLHEVERGLSLAARAGHPLPPSDDARLRISPVAAEPRPALQRPYVVVHPGASVPARAWPVERCAQLVAQLARRGIEVVVTGGPGERALTGAVSGGLPGVVDAGGETGMDGLASLIAAADVLVCGNTGPAHLAAAVGTPVVSLYAPTVPAVRWHPWMVPHELLGDQSIECAGCRARVCPVPGHPCLSSVGVAEVLAAMERLAPRAFHGTAAEALR